MSHRAAEPPGIEQHQFDVIVIGAGINGAGISRDAAMRGLDVLLIEKHDIGSGTTAWSTRLIHGGLRYLEHGELGLVRESLRERETLRRIAPHLVQRLRFLLPVYDWHRRGTRTIRAGMIAYDLLSSTKSLPRHRILSQSEALALAPGLATDRLRGAALYHDAQVTFPERLALENALDAAAHGATILTHVEVERIVVVDGTVAGVDVRHRCDGSHFRAHAATVINAAGPWVDRLLEGLEPDPLIGGTKGSHVVIERFRGAPADAIYSEARDDGRPFFIIPWQNRLLIGTTDVPFEGSPDDPRPSVEEIDYLLRQTLAIYPVASLTRESIMFAYAGVRPLPVAHGRATGAITRRHSIRHHAANAGGLFSVVGGKLTTYRSLAEEVTDIACRRTGHGDRCRTAERPLPGAGDSVAAARRMREARVPAAAVVRLESIYGSRLADLALLVGREPRLMFPVGDDMTTISAEIVFAVGHEVAVTIADVLLRRMMVGLRPGLGLELLEPALSIARDHLGWTDSRIDDERRLFQAEVERLRTPTNQASVTAAYNPHHE